MDSQWPTIQGFTQIGTTGKVRGRHGELKLFIDDEFLTAALEADFLFLEVDGNKVPLEIESMRQVQEILVKFNGINDPGAASKWSSTRVFLPSAHDLREEIEDSETTLVYGFLVGYRVVDDQIGLVGMVSEIREFPQQEMALVNYQGKTVLIPLNPVFIRNIDRTTESLFTDLPEGLLEV